MRLVQRFFDRFQGGRAGDESAPPPAYPYPELLPLLQVLCTPAEYAQVAPAREDWQSAAQFREHALDYPDYWRIVPQYTYAECPICHLRYHEPADTYSLSGWGSGPRLRQTVYVPASFPVHPRCPHFMGIHQFLNLHGVRPVEESWLVGECGEVPYLTRKFFSADVATYAVLHALPLACSEGAAFVPRYTHFLLTYFSADPAAVGDWIGAQLAQLNLEDIMYMDPMRPPGRSLPNA